MYPHPARVLILDFLHEHSPGTGSLPRTIKNPNPHLAMGSPCHPFTTSGHALHSPCCACWVPAWPQVARTVGKSTKEAMLAAEQKLVEQEARQGEEQFQRTFPLLARSGNFVVTYDCMAEHCGAVEPVAGQLMLSGMWPWS